MILQPRYLSLQRQQLQIVGQLQEEVGVKQWGRGVGPEPEFPRLLRVVRQLQLLQRRRDVVAEIQQRGLGCVVAVVVLVNVVEEVDGHFVAEP